MKSNFFTELKRRGVFKVALAYAAIGWLCIALAATIIPLLEMPHELVSFVTIVVLVGFLIALVIAWKFEMTPAGMKRTQDLSPNEVIPYWSRRKYATFILGSIALASILTIFHWVRP